MLGSLGVLLGVLAGCSGDSETTTVTVQATTNESPATETSGDTTDATETTTETGSTDTGEDASQEVAVLASAESSIGGDPARIEIVSLRRSGAVVQLTMRLHNLREEGETGSIQIGSTFDDLLAKYKEFNNPGGTLDAVYLVDGQNRKKYLVARDSEGHPLTDTNLSANFIDPGQFVTLSATLAAPPAEVTEVDVFIPQFGSLPSVPIE